MGARGLGGLGSFRFKGKGGCFGVLGVGVSEANFFSAWGLAFGVWGSNVQARVAVLDLRARVGVPLSLRALTLQPLRLAFGLRG